MILTNYNSFELLKSVSSILVFALCVYYKQIILVIIKTLPRDGKFLVRLIRWQWTFCRANLRNMTLGRQFEEIARKKPDKICLYFENDTWTFEQVSQMSNQVGNYFYEQGLRKGDTVALFMENAPEYVFVCLGLSKIGVVTALVNSNLRLQSLSHYLQVTHCKAVIFNSELCQALEDVKKIGGLKGMPLYCWAKKDVKDSLGSIDLNGELKKQSVYLPVVKEQMNISDRVFYIGTSGTTGLPKAAVFSHTRVFLMIFGAHILSKMSPTDTTYICLPFYHSSGLGVGIGNLICFGCPLAIRKKFSASKFWSDCCRYNATVVPYMGEICRYLLATPPSPYDTQHKVRLMLGAGLRPQIWQNFVDRFKIPMINEIYGATEGNCGIINIDGQVGAAGFYPIWASLVTPAKLIKVDEDTMEPLRDPVTGKCVLCKIGESGEMIGKIDKRHPAANFEGYTDAKSTNSKLLRNVFKDGDSFFRSGDLLVRDMYGYFYFKDRQGDTFRWKSENVSTFEVESVITRSLGLKDVAVYGVAIPGYEGKAGMASIADTDQSLNLKKLSRDVSANLPFYARPVFLRVTEKLELTGSFKMIKTELKKEGLKFPHSKDRIFIFQNNEYVSLTKEMYQSLIIGNLRI